jgi:hypothetical protein
LIIGFNIGDIIMPLLRKTKSGSFIHTFPKQIVKADDLTDGTVLELKYISRGKYMITAKAPKQKKSMI